MPFLDWVNKNQATQASQQVPYRLLRSVSAHGDVDDPNAGSLMALVALNQCLETSQPPWTVAELYEALDWSYRFTKHFYGSHLIHDLQERIPGGELSEQFLCARAIDNCPEVKHWVRNIEWQEKTSFWLPTSTGYFIRVLWRSCTMAECRLLNTRGGIYGIQRIRGRSGWWGHSGRRRVGNMVYFDEEKEVAF